MIFLFGFQAVTGDTVLTRCLKAKKSLEQSLIPIQGMVPVLLAVEVSQFFLQKLNKYLIVVEEIL
jgi:hypothetical protein